MMDIELEIDDPQFVANLFVLFEVKVGEELVGPHALGFAQERVAPHDSETPIGEWQEPLVFSEWAPPEESSPPAPPQFFFDAPYIYDSKVIAGLYSNWTQIEDGTVVPGSIRYQQVRVRYQDHVHTSHFVESPIYKVYMVKVNNTTLRLVHLLKPMP